MESSLASMAVVILLVGAIGYTLLVYLFTIKYDSREPPVLTHYIPYAGHILGLMLRGQEYFEILSANNRNFPIFTLQMLNQRTYIVASPDLVPPIDRNHKTISFLPFISAITPRMFGFSRNSNTMEVIDRNLDGKEGDWGLVRETHKAMHEVMAAGSANLDRMNKTMLSKMEQYFDELASATADTGTTIDLLGWIRPHFTAASTEAIYGPRNPYKLQPELGQSFWNFERDFTKILLGAVPRYWARKGWKGREEVAKGVKAYLDRGDYKDSLGVMQARYALGAKYGASNEDMGRFEIGDAIGILVNATPTVFWTLCHIYSDSILLEEIRKEVSSCWRTVLKPNSAPKHFIDITTLQESCPTLVSTYKEVLRTRTQASTSRVVTEDTLIANKYLLKKDSMLLIPGAIIHANPVWGLDAKEFKPRRFIGKSDIKAGANRTWGGGQSLCPGRFFATAEITNSVAMMVSRFDLSPIGGVWKFPSQDKKSIASSIHPPSTDIRVEIKERQGYEGHSWAFKYADRA